MNKSEQIRLIRVSYRDDLIILAVSAPSRVEALGDMSIRLGERVLDFAQGLLVEPEVDEGGEEPADGEERREPVEDACAAGMALR